MPEIDPDMNATCMLCMMLAVPLVLLCVLSTSQLKLTSLRAYW